MKDEKKIPKITFFYNIPPDAEIYDTIDDYKKGKKEKNPRFFLENPSYCKRCGGTKYAIRYYKDMWGQSGICICVKCGNNTWTPPGIDIMDKLPELKLPDETMDGMNEVDSSKIIWENKENEELVHFFIKDYFKKMKKKIILTESEVKALIMKRPKLGERMAIFDLYWSNGLPDELNDNLEKIHQKETNT
jgi:hypothetical protein